MVRAGAVEHPSQWPLGGYNEIQHPRRKCGIIAHDQLKDLLGFSAYEDLKAAHRLWVEEAIRRGPRSRDIKWTGSMAVGGRGFVEDVRAKLGIRSKGRRITEGEDGCELREPETGYNLLSGLENEDIGAENAYFRENSLPISET